VTPRRTALLAGLVSTVALGVAVAQIMPADRHRLPDPQLSGSSTTIRPSIRDVTPRAGDPQPGPAAQGSPATPAPQTTSPAPQPRTAQQAPASPARPAPRPPVSIDILPDNEDLRERVGSMREKLILAAKSGNIERLGIVFQTNETMPVFTRGGERDPVAFWKQASGDGNGHEILAILLNILDLPAALINKGTPQEMYVWPYLAHVPLDRLTPQQSVDLYRLMTAQDVRDMRTLNAWVFWRLGIGPDGTLHFFLAGE
jgi:hypothetical protein